MCLFFSSCIVVNSGNVSSGPLLNVSDKYVDIATGESTSASFLWVFGEYSNKMVLEAKADLFKNRPLRAREYYSNFSCDITRKYILGIIHITQVIVSAEILKVQDAGAEDGKLAGSDTLKLVGKAFNNSVGLYYPKVYFVNDVDSFFVGDKTFYRKAGLSTEYNAYEIIAINGSDVSLKPVFNSGSNLVVPASEVKFSIKKSLDGYKTGEKVSASLTFGTYDVTTLAFSSNRVLVKADEGYAVCRTTDLKRKP